MQSAFQTTRWTLILQVANNANKDDQQAALAELISLNWFPLYTFLRRSGKKADEAEDLIQGFFARLIEKKTLEQVEGPQRGRFRNFLLVCLKRYISGEWQKSQAQRRGGGKLQLSLDFQAADQRYQIEPFHELTPETAFNRSWALDVIERIHLKAVIYWKTKLISFFLHLIRNKCFFSLWLLLSHTVQALYRPLIKKENFACDH